jgi:hypothetical protein
MMVFYDEKDWRKFLIRNSKFEISIRRKWCVRLSSARKPYQKTVLPTPRVNEESCTVHFPASIGYFVISERVI